MTNPAHVQPVAPFVDWVNLFQSHGGEHGDALPEVGGGRVLRSDMPADKLESESVRYLRHEGSHDTAVFLRSDGRNCSLWGNVGRHGRPDNVWNLSMDETMERANLLMAQHDLPAFLPGRHFIRPVRSERDARLGLFDAWDGCRVSELHLTRNYSAGSAGAAREALRFFTSQRAARLSKSRLGATTVVYGSHAKGGRQVQVYLKADEMLAHAKGEKQKERVRESQLYQYCRDVGLVRVELKLRRMSLRDAGMNYLGGITMDKIISLFERHTTFLLDAAPDRAARLVENMPARLRIYALAWIRGDDVGGMLSRAQFYRVQKALRDYGIDISEPRAVAVQAEADLQRLLDGLPVFDLKALREPEWYSAVDEWRIAA